MSEEISFNPEKPISDIDGVEKKDIFDEQDQARIFDALGGWYENQKALFPEIGFVIDVPRKIGDGLPVETAGEVESSFDLPDGVKLPREAIELFDTITKDSAKDPELGQRDPQFIFERTGSRNTHAEDQGFHLDTKQIYWDDQGNRIGYSKERSLPIYMVYVGRPGSLVIHGKVDPSIDQLESVPIAKSYKYDQQTGITTRQGEGPEPVVSQLYPNSIYKVAAGDLLHRPPVHEDGLLVTVRFNS